MADVDSLWQTVCAVQTTKRKKLTSDRMEQVQMRIREGGAQQVDFAGKYRQLGPLGAGGCGSVFAGYSKKDNSPVAIKHVPRRNHHRRVNLNGKVLPAEVAIMTVLASERDDSVGASSPIELLDWYDLGHELILVLERPVPAMDLWQYTEGQESLEQNEAKNIMKQLVDAAIGLEKRRVFHRDIKLENILIEEGPTAPQVRLIDFGLSCLVEKDLLCTKFLGTRNHIPPEFYTFSTYAAGPTTVWQLGIVLFEMLHCRENFKTLDFLKNKQKIRRQLPKSCRDFLRKCLEMVPEMRPTLTDLRLHPWLR